MAVYLGADSEASIDSPQKQAGAGPKGWGVAARSRFHRDLFNDPH
jgi:hypothetical protein